MFNIGLSARVYDPEGAMVVSWRDGTESESLRRRLTRARTLDLGVSVSNRGFTHADRTMTLSFSGQPQEVVERARQLLRLHGFVTVTHKDGAFIGALSEYNDQRQELTVLITGTA